MTTDITRAMIANIPITDIVNLKDAEGKPMNPSGRTADTTELQATIKAVGQLQPIGVVRVGDKFGIVFGHRRVTAIRAMNKAADDTVKQLTSAGVKDDRLAIAMAEREQFSTVEARLFDVSYEDHTALRMLLLAENSARRELSLLEQADALKKLSDAGIPMTRAAGVVGATADRARFILDLATAPEEVRQAISSGKLDLEGYRAMRALPADAQAEIAETANALENGKKMSRAHVRGAVEKKRSEIVRPDADEDDGGDMFDDDDEQQERRENRLPALEPKAAKQTKPALDSERLINQAQAAVNSLFDVLAQRSEWPEEAKPALQWQFQRLRSRLGVEGFNVDVAPVAEPAVEVVKAGVPLVDLPEISRPFDTAEQAAAFQAWQDAEHAGIMERPALPEFNAADPVLAAELEAERYAEGADEDQEEDAELTADDKNPMVVVEYKADAPSMKFTIKVKDHRDLNTRKRNAAGVIAYLLELQKSGYRTDSVTLEDLQNAAV